MTQYRKGFEAGREYGKNYRRTHRSWSSDMSIARRAADAISGTYDVTGYTDGVIKGLQPFASCDFAKVFEHNAQLAPFKAFALLGGVRLQVASQSKEHYQTTLAYWQEIGAIITEEG